MLYKLCFRPGSFRLLMGKNFQAKSTYGASYLASAEKLPINYALTKEEFPTPAMKLEDWEKADALFKSPSRDYENFPIFTVPDDPPPVRFGIFPDHFFQRFYNRTGVTGPYVLLAFGVTTLLSKEIWVSEHHFADFVAFWALIAFVYVKFGDKIRTFADKEIDAADAKFTDNLKATQTLCQDQVDVLQQAIDQQKSLQYIFQAKRENVDMQLEASYRQRIATVYGNVKKRLDYHALKMQMERNLQQKHMVEWIVNNVRKSITPEQEKANIRQCIVNLKGLAASV